MKPLRGKKGAKVKLQKLWQQVRDNQIAILIVAVGIILRLLPHPANFAPVGAIALFGGTYLNKKWAVWLPLVVMIATDSIIGFHNLVLFTWGSLVLIALLGLWLRNHKNIPNIIFGTLTGSLLFFFITNFGVWAFTPMYAHTWAGLVYCFVMAVPFFRNTVASDLFYVGVFFGTYEMAKYLAPKFKETLLEKISR
jgi:hypothetical protein